MKHDLLIEREQSEGHVCIKVLAPEHCIVAESTPDWTLRDCPYFEYREQKTIADLRAMGLDVPEDVSDDEKADVSEDWAVLAIQGPRSRGLLGALTPDAAKLPYFGLTATKIAKVPVHVSRTGCLLRWCSNTTRALAGWLGVPLVLVVP